MGVVVLRRVGSIRRQTRVGRARVVNVGHRKDTSKHEDVDDERERRRRGAGWGEKKARRSCEETL